MKLLWKLYKAEQIDLVFADEAGFQMVPSLPYSWQPTGKWVRILPQKGKMIRLFGLLYADNRLHIYPNQGSMNAEFIIESLDDFVQKITKPTVIILDNAPIHRAQIVKQRRRLWEQKNLYLFFLPKYSPHLNRIEILWRKMKYEWIEPKHYRSWGIYTKAVTKLIEQFGSEKYNIKFNEPFYTV